MAGKSPPGRNVGYALVGLQYYLSGRFAALNVLSPVALNLFHHGAEVLMKYGLSGSLTVPELKRLGHNLPAILVAFAQMHEGIDPHSIDRTVRELNRCEDLRYPDLKSPSGATFGVVWSDQDKLPTASPSASYILSLEEIDRLFYALITATGTGALLTMLADRVGDIYSTRNSHPIDERD